MGVANGRGWQEVGVASGWNLWVWLECIGVVSECCCKDIFIIITFPYSTCISSFWAASSLFPCSVFKNVFSFFTITSDRARVQSDFSSKTAQTARAFTCKIIVEL